MPRRGTALFSTLFFLSGMAGLIYEVSWTRLLRLPMGNTVYSMTAVLTAFMAGLALGAWLAGRWIDRRGHPLRVYALLEAAIGVFCLLLPWIVQAEEPLFRWAYRHHGASFLAFHLFTFAACAIVVLVPATLMGATLPVLCRYFIEDAHRIGRSLGWLYAVNALGAAAGSLLAGFVLVPKLGQQGAILVGVATSLSVAAVAWVAHRRLPYRLSALLGAEPKAEPAAVRGGPVGRSMPARPRNPTAHRRPAAPPAEVPLGRALRWVLLVGYGLSGLAAMVFQIAWARVLSLALGSSVYAFSLLVSAFVLGLALGSALASRFADRLRLPVLGFAVAELGIGFTALAMVPFFQRFPEWMLRIVPHTAADFTRFQLVQFGLVFAALLLPTACMGACLPLVGRALVRGLDHAAETVGTAYSTNAVGTILGAFLGGFVLLPSLGMDRTIQFGAALNLGLGALLLGLVLPRRRAVPLAGATVVAGALGIAFMPRFDPAVFTSGAYLYAGQLVTQLGGQRNLRQLMQDQYRIQLHREGLTSTITVKDATSGTRSLFINGKADASDDRDMSTQSLCGHIASLLHPAPQDAAIVGLATGVTVNAVRHHPSIRSVDCIEIAPEMAEACRLFDHVNDSVLDDPRVSLIVQDGRNHLTLTDRQYDLIVSEPSNPWISGIASLFTREFLQACHDRLRPGGVMCMWVHAYGMDLQALRSLARTFLEVFPEATLWETMYATDYTLVGVKGPLQGRWADLEKRMAEPVVAADLARIGIRSSADLLVRHLTDAAGMRRLATGGGLYTDDHNRLEFDAPRLMHRGTTLEELRALQELRRAGPPTWLQDRPDEIAAELRAHLQAAQTAQGLFWRGSTRKLAGDEAGAVSEFIAALERDRHLRDVWPQLLDASRAVVRSLQARGDATAAEGLYARMVAFEPDLADVYNDYGVLQGTAGRMAEAEASYRQALQLRPRSTYVLHNLVQALLAQRRGAEAEPYLRRLVELRPDDLRGRLTLGTVLLDSKRLGEAEQEFEIAVRDHPGPANGWFLLGEARRMRGALREAIVAYEAAAEREPGMREAQRRLAECYGQVGEREKAALAAARAAGS